MDVQAGMRDTMSLVKKFNKLQIIVAMCVMICLMVNISTVTAFAAGGGPFAGFNILCD